MMPYEEIDFPNGFLRWIREDGEYVCRMTEEQMVKIKAIHELPSTWVGLTDEELQPIADEYRILFGSWVKDFAQAIEAKLKEKNA